VTLYRRDELALTLFEESGDALFLFDPATEQVLDANPMAERLSGFTHAELLQLKATYLFRSDVQGGLVRLRHAFQKTGVFHSQEGFLLRHRKERVWIPVNLTVTRLHARPQPLGLITARDISERHRAEEALRRQAQIIDQIHDAVISTDLEGHVTSWNKGAERLYGYRAEEMLGKHILLLYPEECRDSLPQLVMNQLREHDSYDVEVPKRRKSGETFYVHMSLSLVRGPDGAPRGMIGYTVDITERKQAEQSLRDSEALYHSLVENLPQNVFRKDRAGRFTFANQRFAALLGRPIEEILGKTDFDFFPPELAEKYRQDDQRVLDTGAIFETVEEHAPPGGGKLFVEVVKTPVHDAQGRIIGTQCIFWDISERKRADETLRLSEERYRSLVESSIQGIFVATPAGKLLACNPAFTRIFGFASIAEAMSRSLASLYADGRAYEVFVNRVRREKKLELYEAELRRRDGRPVHAIANVVGSFDDHGDLVEIKGYIFDNTERKRLEEQFRQAQKMEAVGRLAGGVAHDFNNLLTVITGYGEILLGRIPRADPCHGMIAEVQRAAERAAALTRQLLAFSRKQILAPVELDLNVVVGDMEGMVRRLIGEDIALVTIRDPALGRVTADRGQIEQVLMNLVVNARDAMPEGGELTIETRNVTLDAPRPAADAGVGPGPYVMLTVRDTGCGMDTATQARLFEPFFTTKEIGKGTGLGLATAYGIIKQSKGHIEVESAPGRGASFTIYLPRTPHTEAVAKPAESPNGVPRGTETVLLVEDEDAVRRLSRHILEMIGYRVLEARDGPEALTVCGQSNGAIDLMITDVVMPHMSGRQLADQLVPRYPRMRVLYLSGYTDEAISHHGVLDREVAFLSKPFTFDALARKVREVLDRSSTP
jgi:PAS domain S-box-containing protein